MGMDLWFREDVARILASTYETMRSSTAALQREGRSAGASAYEQGFVDALRAMAVAFGLATPGSRGVSPLEVKATLWPALDGLRSGCDQLFQAAER